MHNEIQENDQLFTWKEFLSYGRIYDSWSLTHKMVLFIIICTLYQYDAFD